MIGRYSDEYTMLYLDFSINLEDWHNFVLISLEEMHMIKVFPITAAFKIKSKKKFSTRREGD
jgi:hypothetical protein